MTSLYRYTYYPNDSDGMPHWFQRTRTVMTYRDFEENEFLEIIDWCREQFGPPNWPDISVRWAYDGGAIYMTYVEDAFAFRMRWC